MDKEKLINKIMRDCEKDGEPVTHEEAAKMADMELKAQGIKRYEQSAKPRKPSTRERKVDETKQYLLAKCEKVLRACGTNILSIKTETELTFTYNEEEYSLKLIKHRTKKEQK